MKTVDEAIEETAAAAIEKGRLMAIAHKRSIAQLARYSLATWKLERSAPAVYSTWIDPIKEYRASFIAMMGGIVLPNSMFTESRT